MTSFPARASLAIAATLLVIFAVQAVGIVYSNWPPLHRLTQPNGQILGGDFVTFYNAGHIARSNPDKLYDLSFQEQSLNAFLGDEAGALGGKLPFVYPPLVALLFSFISLLPYKSAYIVWGVISFAAALTSLWLFGRCYGLPSKGLSAALVLGSLGYIPFILNCVASGQLAWIGIVLFSGTIINLTKRRELLAGLFFSLSYYKPPLFLLALIILFICSSSNFRLGFLAGAVILSAASVLYSGLELVSSYFAVVTRYTYGQDLQPGLQLPTDQGAGIVALIFASISNRTLCLWAVLGLIVLLSCIGLILNRRMKAGNSLRLELIFYSFLVCSSVGMSAQCIRYDLSILLVAFVMLLALTARYLDNIDKFVLAACCCGFYVEWFYRGYEWHGKVYNISSVLFVAIIAALTYMGLKNGKSKAQLSV